MARVKVLVGAQWGDEGKGKWCDVFSKQADIVVRFQGGNNAGHTLYLDGKKVVLHQLPSGLFHKNQVLALAAGMVINPDALVAEIKGLGSLASKLSPETLWISEQAQVITPWHLYQDDKRERSIKNPIGTTKKGIGPAYQDKAQRVGLTFKNYVDKPTFFSWLDKRCSGDKAFTEHYEAHAELWQSFINAADYFRSYVTPVEWRLRHLLKSEQSILFEGAQGSLLDINHGTYPYVTSSSTIAAGAASSVGFDPRAINDVVGIAKAYVTRVGEGPFPTEIAGDLGKSLAKKGCEFGATTNRPRRCGWFDSVAMRYAVLLNGLDRVLLNKLDILSGFETLKIAVSYEHPTLGTLSDFPTCSSVLNACKVNYETLSGWEENLPTSGKTADLPLTAQHYVQAIEDFSHCKIAYVGTGPGRSEYLERS